MRAQKLFVPILLGLAMVLQGCTPGTTIQSNEATLQAAVQQTLDAEKAALTATEAARPAATLRPTETTVPIPTRRPSSTPDTPDVTQTAFQPPIPLVSVSVSTNCRSGPGTDFELLGDLQAGDVAEVIGKYPSMNYWIIKNPDKAGNCWLWGEYATVIGSTALVPLVAPPATPSVPILMVSLDTTCYSGPSDSYIPLGTINIGERPVVYGRDPYSNFFLIKNPDAAGNCWISGENATVQGSIALISTAETPTPPASSADYRCSIVERSPKDGDSFKPGANFDAYWSVKNTGDKTWKTVNVRYGYLSGTKMYEGKDKYAISEDVKPGKTYDIRLDMVAPEQKGTYSMLWYIWSGETQVCTLPVYIVVK